MKSPAKTEYEVIEPAFKRTQMVQSPTTHDVTPYANTPTENKYENPGVMAQTANQENLYERPTVSGIQYTGKDYEILYSAGRNHDIN